MVAETNDLIYKVRLEKLNEPPPLMLTTRPCVVIRKYLGNTVAIACVITFDRQPLLVKRVDALYLVTQQKLHLGHVVRLALGPENEALYLSGKGKLVCDRINHPDNAKRVSKDARQLLCSMIDASCFRKASMKDLEYAYHRKMRDCVQEIVSDALWTLRVGFTHKRSSSILKKLPEVILRIVYAMARQKLEALVLTYPISEFRLTNKGHWFNE